MWFLPRAGVVKPPACGLHQASGAVYASLEGSLWILLGALQAVDLHTRPGVQGGGGAGLDSAEPLEPGSSQIESLHCSCVTGSDPWSLHCPCLAPVHKDCTPFRWRW